MQMKPEQAFDIPRENLRFALRWVQLANDWRKHMYALRVRQIELDASTLKRERDALAACSDWSEMFASTQTVMRDHAAEMMSLMQEGIGLELSERNTLPRVFSESLTVWQEAWLGQMNPIAAAVNVSESMLRDVIRGAKFEHVSARAPGKGDQHVA